jgi:4-amino-4-deoxy-L-arabinose transferase-like glycosyltransferase
MTDTFSGPKALWIPIVIFLGAFLIIASTNADYGVSWDEPAYFYASDLHIQWLADFGKNLLHGRVGQSLRDDVIKAAWQWDPYHVPHPPFSRIVSGTTKAIFSPLLDKFVSYRFGPAIFFSLLVTVMYLWMTEIFGRLVGLVAALSLMLIPNLFGFAHIAVADMPLTTMWFLTVFCFWKGLQSWKWSLALGVVWGLAIATKFPAVLIPIPLLFWAHLYQRRSYANNFFCMIFVAPIVMIATQPYLWHQTPLRILEFFYQGLSRGYRPDANFPIFFLNRLYFTNELPWYYTFFLTAVTTPETILGLCLIGILALVRVRPERKVVVLLLFNLLFILILGVLPGAVLHDGMRQLLSGLPFVAALSAVGFFILMKGLTEWAQQKTSFHAIKNLRSKVIGALLALFLFPPALELFLYHPFELSYYNRFVGGIRGAYERGLETTYFMEALTPEFLKFLNRELPPNAVLNGLFSSFMLEYYQNEGKLRRDIKITDNGNFDYAIVIIRRSVLSAMRRSQLAVINERALPIASVSLAGVPLVILYRTKT